MRTGVKRVSSAGRPETKEESERWNRNFTELLQELRVVQTGVQILFAFLLTVPFSNRFGGASTLQVVIYTLTFLACAVAVALLIAPASYHRRVFRQGRKAEVVMQADRLAQAGLAALIVAVAGVVFLIMDVLAGLIVACALSALVTIVYILLWYVLPYLATSRDESRGPYED
jgi:phosphotransferase system  glucose/maltose/N-acetylglucosamine-specific IIC component